MRHNGQSSNGTTPAVWFCCSDSWRHGANQHYFVHIKSIAGHGQQPQIGNLLSFGRHPAPGCVVRGGSRTRPAEICRHCRSWRSQLRLTGRWRLRYWLNLVIMAVYWTLPLLAGRLVFDTSAPRSARCSPYARYQRLLARVCRPATTNPQLERRSLRLRDRCSRPSPVVAYRTPPAT